MAQYGVSRSVVREAISHLQAAGLVQTRHGIGTFVLEAPPRRRSSLAILELRIGMETEAAGLAASRRTGAQLAALREALADMRRAQEAGQPTVEADVRFHRLLAESSANRYFVDMQGQLGKVLSAARTAARQLRAHAPRARGYRRRHRAPGCGCGARRDAHAFVEQPRTAARRARKRPRQLQRRPCGARASIAPRFSSIQSASSAACG
jgi:GntR family transcriptional repressor for pyruvate dehydrogenase complex